MQEINRSRLPLKPTQQPLEEEASVESTKVSKSQGKSTKVSKSQGKSTKLSARKSSKRKAETLDEDKVQTASETKISPAAKRLKRTVKDQSSPLQTKNSASPKKKPSRIGRKNKK